jgi:hypothetical protein
MAKLANGSLPGGARAAANLRAEQARLRAALGDVNTAMAGQVVQGTKVSERTNLLGSQVDRAGGSLVTFAAKVRATTTSYRAQVSANKTLHDSLLSSRDAILSQADAFEHGRAASKVKTSSVLADLRREVATLKTWAADAQTLIRRGMDPAAVKFLSDKGPQYLRAFATGSDRQVAGFEKLFKQRMVASGNVAFRTTVGAAEDFRRMVAKANADTARIKAAKARVEGRAAAEREFRRFRNEANRALDQIADEKIKVTATADVDATRRTIKLNRQFGGRALLAEGGWVWGPGTETSDSIRARLSRGEFVVNARSARRHRDTLEAINEQRYATGGLVGVRPDPDLPSPAPFGRRGGVASRIAQRVAADVAGRTAKAVANRMADAIQANMVSGAGDVIGYIINFIRSAVPNAKVISTFRPGARTRGTGSVSLHALRRAVDFTGDKMAIWKRAVQIPYRKEVIYSPAPYQEYRSGIHRGPPSNPRTRADHYSHVHVGVFGGPGGLNPPSGAGMGGGPAPSTANQRTVRRVFAQMFGWDRYWGSTFKLLMGESGFRNTAQNPTSTAYGMFQFLNSTWAGTGIRKTSDPYRQSVAGGRYIRSAYGNPGNAYAKWLRRRPHWYGAGLDAVFGSPTLIGVGERGPERVSVQPVGRAGGVTIEKGAITVPLQVIGDVTVAQRAQMVRIAEDMGERLAAELSDALARRGSGV